MNQLQEDLDHVLYHTRPLWANVHNKTIFITGGTGFFGKWLLSSFVYINKELGLNNKLIVLTRNSSAFLNSNPQFKNVDCIQFINGDVRTFVFPAEQIDYIIHAATEASVALNLAQPLLMYDTIVEGTKRVLELGLLYGVKSILHTSSGAMYGVQPSGMTHVNEEYSGAPQVLGRDAAYGEGKRVAEMMAAMYYSNYNLHSKIARCYAFIGPFLPQDSHFAAGNFMNNVLLDQNIVIKGDGTPRRSYLYASDLAVWLWTVLFKGESIRPYNVGSDLDLSIEELAIKIKQVSKKDIAIEVLSPKNNSDDIERYVPDVTRAKIELGLDILVDLNTAILKTLNYYKSQAKNEN